MKRFLVLLVCIIFSAESAFGYEKSDIKNKIDEINSENYQIITDNLPGGVFSGDDAETVMEKIKSFDILNYLKELKNSFKEFLTAPLKSFALVAFIIFTAAFINMFCEGFGSGSTQEIFNLIIAVTAGEILFVPVFDLIGETRVIINDFTLFLSTYIPVFAGIMTASGAPVSAAGYNIFMFTLCEAAAQIIDRLFIPLMSGFLAVSLASSAAPNLKITSAVKSAQSLINWGLTLSLTVLMGVLSVNSAVSAGTDGLAFKTTKFMIGSFVPGIGSALSDLYETAYCYIGTAKSAVGLLGIVVTIMTFLPQLLTVGIYYLMLMLLGTVSEMFGADTLGELLSCVKGTMGMLFSVLLYDGLIVIISTSIMILSVRQV